MSLKSTNLNKAKAYKKVVGSFDEAVDILNSKKLAFGEPAVVPFYYPEDSSSIRLAIGYGSLNGGVEIVSSVNIPQDKRIDDSTVEVRDVDSSTSIMTVADAFEYVLYKIDEFNRNALTEKDINDIINGNINS